MESKELSIKGVFLCTPKVFEDERGSFMESYNQREFNKALNTDIEFVQDNHSVSKLGVFRGLHFQKPPYAQAKLIRVVKGSVLDVVLDIRTGSDTYGEFETIEITADSCQSLFIPAGMAHGFLSLEDDTHFSYKCSAYYQPDFECTIDYKSLKGLSFEYKNVIINKKDAEGENLKNFNSPF